MNIHAHSGDRPLSAHSFLPNPVFERTRRQMTSNWQSSERRAAQLIRWAEKSSALTEKTLP